MSADTGKWILYQTTNLINNKIYIGVHKLSNTIDSKRYLGSGNALKLAIRKYGRKSFTRTTLTEFNCASEAYVAEAGVVTKEFCSREDTYNIKTGGIGGLGGRLGAKCTEEHKAKIGAANKGKIISEAHKVILRAVNIGNKNCLGRVHTEEARAKIKAARKNQIITEKHKAKMRASKTGAKNHLSLAVIINDTYYESANMAAKSENVPSTTAMRRVKSNSPQFANYRFATEEEKTQHHLPRITCGIVVWLIRIFTSKTAIF